MKVLYVYTESGAWYKVNERDEISRTDMPLYYHPTWKMIGLRVRHYRGKKEYLSTARLRDTLALQFIPGASSAPRVTLIYKNGKPRATLVDIDHGSRRAWGDGIVEVSLHEEKE